MRSTGHPCRQERRHIRICVRKESSSRRLVDLLKPRPCSLIATSGSRTRRQKKFPAPGRSSALNRPEPFPTSGVENLEQPDYSTKPARSSNQVERSNSGSNRIREKLLVGRVNVSREAVTSDHFDVPVSSIRILLVSRFSKTDHDPDKRTERGPAWRHASVNENMATALQGNPRPSIHPRHRRGCPPQRILPGICRTFRVYAPLRTGNDDRP